MTSSEGKAATGAVCVVCGSADARPWRKAGDQIMGGAAVFTAVICKRCGTARLFPRPDAAEMNAHYTPTTYARAEGEQAGSPLDERLTTFFAHQATRADEMALADRGMPRRLLDVGCGDGRFLRAMGDLGWTGAGVETEPAARSLATARTGLPIYDQPLETAPIGEAAWDMVSLLHVLEHVPDPRETLTVARKALRGGGTLLLALPNIRCIEAHVFGNSWYPLDLPRHYWGFTPHTLVRLVEECGFRVTGLRYLPFLFAPQSARYALRQVRGKPVVPPNSGNAAGGDSDLKTRLFLALLHAAESAGRTTPGEVMELAARAA